MFLNAEQKRGFRRTQKSFSMIIPRSPQNPKIFVCDDPEVI